MQEQSCDESFLFSAKKYFIHKYDSNNSRVLFVCLFFSHPVEGKRKEKGGRACTAGKNSGQAARRSGAEPFRESATGGGPATATETAFL